MLCKTYLLIGILVAMQLCLEVNAINSMSGDENFLAKLRHFLLKSTNIDAEKVDATINLLKKSPGSHSTPQDFHEFVLSMIFLGTNISKEKQLDIIPMTALFTQPFNFGEVERKMNDNKLLITPDQATRIMKILRVLLTPAQHDQQFNNFVDMLMHIINGSAGKKDDVISKETLINFAKQGMYGTDRRKDEF